MFRTDQENTFSWQAGTFTFPLKKNYACQSLTNGARLKNVPPPLDLTGILKSYHKRNGRRKFPEKPHEVNHAAWLIKNGKTLFNKHTRKFLAEKARRRGDDQVTGFLPTHRYLSFFCLVILTMYVVLFILEKCYKILINYFLYLLQFGSTTFVYYGKTFRRPCFFH